jgi:NAD(P)-dependent dehydrogenase (short-subunit alcohol dehydrogenase family)
MNRRVALVTGGHRRLGRAIALHLADHGYDVVISYRRGEAEVASALHELGLRGARAVALQAELTDAAQVRALIADTAALAGRLDAVVASAASYRPTPLGELDGSQLDQCFAENARAPVELLLAAAPWLRQSGDGRAVLIGDLAGITPLRGYLAHSMAKAALHAAVAGLAAEWAPHIVVGGVAPGAVLPPETMDSLAWEALQSRVPMGQLAMDQPTEPVLAVCAAVHWWLSCPRYATGQVLRVDGGRSARW